MGIAASDARRICGLAPAQSERPELRIHHPGLDNRLSGPLRSSALRAREDKEVTTAHSLL